MEKEEQFGQELENLLMKYNVPKATLLIHFDAYTRICAYSKNKDEEQDQANTYVKLNELIGNLNYDTIAVLNNFLTEYYKEQVEIPLKQTTWESLAYETAQVKLSEIDLKLLNDTREKKQELMKNYLNLEEASKYRKLELDLLKKAMS